MNDFNLDNLLRNNIKKLIPYSSARSEFEGETQVFLDANENSYGSSINRFVHRYPDPLQKQLKQKIGKIKNIKTENIFLGNGSDEAIDLLIRAFCVPSKDNIVTLQPTYGMYEVAAAINDVEIKKVQLDEKFQPEVADVLKTIDEHTKIIFICSPNNPSGNLIEKSAVEFMLKNFCGIIVVDEAYIDFAGTTSWLQKFNNHPNLVVLQTLSKAWALAGLRIGIAFASVEIIHVLNKIKPPYNISFSTQQLALQALDKKEDAANRIQQILLQKTRLEKELLAFRFIKNIYPSDANFLLVKVEDAKKIYDYLISKNIVVRNRNNQPGCKNCLRITIGTKEENDELLEALQNFSK